MKRNVRSQTNQALLATVLGVGAACSASALEVPLTFFGTNLPSLDFHGFASQGFLASSDYNYLGNDTKNGSFQFSEAGLNVALNPLPRTRITAQAFTYDVGNDVGKYDVILDYAQAEYTFNDKIGIRAGRIRRAQGLYNSIVDVDLARTSILLPQGMYDSRFRDFYTTLDGGEFFGSIPLGKAGSLSYEAYGGMINPAMDGGAAKLFRNELFGLPVHLDSISSAPMGGVQLWWNTPLDGLRVGASAIYIAGVEVDTTVFGIFHNVLHEDATEYQGSVEYLWKQWTFQAEYMYRSQFPTPGASINTDTWYASAAYRFNKWFEAGTYYTEYYNDTTKRNDSTQYQKDLALSLRFDLRDWWVFKVEGHYLHGTGLLQDTGANPVQHDNGWFMLGVKTTFSF